MPVALNYPLCNFYMLYFMISLEWNDYSVWWGDGFITCSETSEQYYQLKYEPFSSKQRMMYILMLPLLITIMSIWVKLIYYYNFSPENLCLRMGFLSNGCPFPLFPAVAVILFTRLRVLTVKSPRYVMTLYYFIGMICW